VAREFRAKGIHLQLVLLDRSDVHLRGSDFETAGRVAGDAFALPFRDGSLELVSCALMAHHLGPDEIVRFVNEALRVARVAVLINDLRRSRMHLAAVYAGFALYRSRLTRHDAPASVRRAYTRRELQAILERTQAQSIEIRNHYLFRMGAIAWKTAPATSW
jgi:ubiquinone/menaquinone biosynthesis C-methylase UbiE